MSKNVEIDLYFQIENANFTQYSYVPREKYLPTCLSARPGLHLPAEIWDACLCLTELLSEKLNFKGRRKYKFSDIITS